MAIGISAENTGRIATDGSVRIVKERFYHPELDVLRFIAFLMVFIFHGVPSATSFLSRGLPRVIVDAITGFSSAGGFGVDVFFVLSAYLITELLLRERAQFGEVDVGSFYLRRILRIWPLYFVFLFSAYAASRWLTGTQDSRGMLVAFMLLGGNWWVIFRGWPSLAISPLWSVSVEEQFYLLWPPLVRRLTRQQLLITSALMLAIAASAQLYLVLHHVEEEYIACNTFARMDPIAFGIIAAVLLEGRTPKVTRWMRLTLFAAGLGALMFAACCLHTKDDPTKPSSILVGYPLVAVGSVMMLIAVLSKTRPWFARGPLVSLGRISYGLYVFHFLCLIVAGKITKYLLHGQAVRGGMILAFLLTVILAVLSYYLLEMPFLRLKERLARIPSRPCR